MRKKIGQNWILISIEDLEGLPGTTFLNLIQLLLRVVNFKFAIIDDIEAFACGQYLGHATSLPNSTDLGNIKNYNNDNELVQSDNFEQEKAIKAYSFLRNAQNKSIDLDELLSYIGDIRQFNWGDFFLFESYPSSWINDKNEYYPYIISQADTTIRAIDSQYIYIYTPYQGVVDLINANYLIESIKQGSLESLDYPE